MLLTVEQARGSINTALPDDDLRRLLDAAEEVIDGYCGRLSENATQPVTSHHLPAWGGTRLILASRAAEIVEVSEGSSVLSADDYTLRPSGTILYREPSGTTPAISWRSPVTVTYVPYSDINSRCVAQLALVRLDITFNPGIASQSIGPWSESYGGGKSYPEQRADILAAIDPPFVGIW